MRIPSTKRKSILRVWIYAVVYNGWLVFLLLLGCWGHPFAYHGPRNPLALIFPIAGLLLLGYAISETVRRKTYGETYFISDEEHFAAGSRLHGKIVFSRHAPVSPNRHFRLSLSCILVTSGSNANNGLAWTDAHPVDPARDGSIPVEFDLPHKVTKAFFVMGNFRTVWELKVKETGGKLLPFHAEYYLPIAITPKDDMHAQKR